MTGVSKRFFIGLAIFAVAAIVYAGSVQIGFQYKIITERSEEAQL